MTYVIAALVGLMVAFPVLTVLGGREGARREQAIRDSEADRARGETKIVGVHGPEFIHAPR